MMNQFRYNDRKRSAKAVTSELRTDRDDCVLFFIRKVFEAPYRRAFINSVIRELTGL